MLSGVQSPKKKRPLARLQSFLKKIDEIDMEGIRRIVYRVSEEIIIPTVSMIFERAMGELNFPHQALTMRRLLKKMGFRYKKYERRTFVKECPRIRILR